MTPNIVIFLYLLLSSVLQVSPSPNVEFDIIAQSLKLVRYKGEQVRLRHLSVHGLLPQTDDYITYEGSLTQPGCQETVTWVIINKPIYISSDHVCNLFVLVCGISANCLCCYVCSGVCLQCCVCSGVCLQCCVCSGVCLQCCVYLTVSNAVCIHIFVCFCIFLNSKNSEKITSIGYKISNLIKNICYRMVQLMLFALGDLWPLLY